MEWQDNLSKMRTEHSSPVKYFLKLGKEELLMNSPQFDIATEHARIQYKDRKHYLENLDNMGRSFVNAVQVDLVELKDNDVVRLGDIKFQVEYATSSRKGSNGSDSSESMKNS